MPLADLSIGDRMRLCPHDGRYVIDEIKEVIGCHDCGIRGYSATPMVHGDERRCGGCHIIKPLEEFWRNRAKPKGRNYLCKTCKSEYQRGRYAELSDA